MAQARAKPKPRKPSERPRKSSKRPQRDAVKRRPRRAPRQRWAILCSLLIGGPLLLVSASYVGLWVWAKQPGPGNGRLVALHIPGASRAEVAHQLAERGIITSPWLFSTYLALLKPKLSFETGDHLLLDSLAPRDLAAQLARLPQRASLKVTLLEGWNHLEMGRRFEQRGVCSLAAFVDAVRDEALLDRLGFADFESAEGYLFPDTYDLHLDSSPEAVIVTMVQHAKKKLAELRLEHATATSRLSEVFGFSEYEWVTLASILEKEAANPAELPTIASVFFNRLSDPSFRPERMLQSDPTAAYGCRVEPERAGSCNGFRGSVRPEMLRDADNRYNTYKHPGLPPGPISNPGRAALLAVLNPADTPYLFFFADGKRGHTFTRTFEEHRAAIRRRSER